MNQKDKISFGTAFLPVGSLLLLIVFGLFIGPKLFGIDKVPLEIIFILSGIIAIVQLLVLGFKWDDILDGIVHKIGKAMPTLLILLCIGLIIGSWIACGTIPMLVYYGIKMISPDYIYLVAFVVPVVFSTVTGTSWGSVGTIGVVMMGVADAYDANMAITAGAVIGGSAFGDKLSPLSDTTNIAALATEINVYDHIRSMLYTTLPAALVACGFYFVIAWFFPAESGASSVKMTTQILNETAKGFNFNLLLLIPPSVVLYGSIKRIPTLQVLMMSTFSAVFLAVIFQPFQLGVIFDALITGFSVEAFDFKASEQLQALFNRGGLYSLKEPLVISIFVFVFVGAIEKINAMPIIVNRIFGWVKRRGAIVRAALVSTSITNAMTSNQYAASFIVGDAFKDKFDKANLHRKVLSRSLEDTGTMQESLIPWHQTCIFMAATTGVAVADYWYFQVFSLTSIVLAFAFTFLGIGLFKKDGSGA